MQITNQSIFTRLGTGFASIFEGGNEDDKLRFFLRAKEPLTQNNIDDLQGAGGEVPVDSTAKKVITVSARLGDIPQIAALDFIQLLTPPQQLDPK